MHHKRRYENVIRLSAYYYGQNITEREKETAQKLLSANADNYDAQAAGVYFYRTPEEMEDIVL